MYNGCPHIHDFLSKCGATATCSCQKLGIFCCFSPLFLDKNCQFSTFSLVWFCQKISIFHHFSQFPRKMCVNFFIIRDFPLFSRCFLHIADFYAKMNAKNSELPDYPARRISLLAQSTILCIKKYVFFKTKLAKNPASKRPLGTQRLREIFCRTSLLWSGPTFYSSRSRSHNKVTQPKKLHNACRSYHPLCHNMFYISQPCCTKSYDQIYVCVDALLEFVYVTKRVTPWWWILN